jgi:hypothetical protein
LGIPALIIPASLIMRFIYRRKKDLYLTEWVVTINCHNLYKQYLRLADITLWFRIRCV